MRFAATLAANHDRAVVTAARSDVAAHRTPADDVRLPRPQPSREDVQRASTRQMSLAQELVDFRQKKMWTRFAARLAASHHRAVVTADRRDFARPRRQRSPSPQYAGFPEGHREIERRTRRLQQFDVIDHRVGIQEFRDQQRASNQISVNRTRPPPMFLIVFVC